jgi:hypothetical protein
MSHTLLHHIDDYAPNGLEFGEITQQLLMHLDHPEQVFVHNTSVPPLDTMALGFVTAQYALAPHKGRMVVYGNAAPRRDQNKAKKENIADGIKYARLDNGVEIINAVNKCAYHVSHMNVISLKMGFK